MSNVEEKRLLTRAELRRLLAAATKGPWEAWVPLSRTDTAPFMIGPFATRPVEIRAPEVDEIVTYLKPWNRVQDEADSQLIAQARNVLPELLDAIDAAETALEVLSRPRKPSAVDAASEYAAEQLRLLREAVPRGV